MFLFINSIQEKKISLALFKDPSHIQWFDEPVKNKSRENILIILDKALKQSKKKIKDIHGIIVVNGPGSFVGIRIALSVANVLGYVLSIPVKGVNFSKGKTNNDLIKKSWPQISKRKKYKAVQPFYNQEPNITINKKKMKTSKKERSSSKEKLVNIPNHIGFIVDGNRRWARQRNLPSNYGHLMGYKKVKKVIDWSFDKGVKVLSFYIFSTENWVRSQREINHLMKLIKQIFCKDLKYFMKREIKLLISGRINDPRLSAEIKKIIQEAKEKTKNNKKGIINLAFNYGGRSEIIQAIKRIIKEKIKASAIKESLINKYLWSPGLPDPDLIVRTSEKRLSGFLLWQSAYAELCFIDKHWPSITEKDVDDILDDYSQRKRRFGK